MERFIMQQITVSGFIHYEIIDTENKCKTIFKSTNYAKTMEILKQYNNI